MHNLKLVTYFSQIQFSMNNRINFMNISDIKYLCHLLGTTRRVICMMNDIDEYIAISTSLLKDCLEPTIIYRIRKSYGVEIADNLTLLTKGEFEIEENVVDRIVNSNNEYTKLVLWATYKELFNHTKENIENKQRYEIMMNRLYESSKLIDTNNYVVY